MPKITRRLIISQSTTPLQVSEVMITKDEAQLMKVLQATTRMWCEKGKAIKSAAAPHVVYTAIVIAIWSLRRNEDMRFSIVKGMAGRALK
jgi:hypothetical protein